MPARPCRSTATALRRDATSSRSPGTPPTLRRRREERESASSAAHLRLAQGSSRRRRAGMSDIVRAFGGLALLAGERAVTAVTDGEQTAQRHAPAAGPYPADQRLDVAAHADHADDEHRHAEMRKLHAEEAARQTGDARGQRSIGAGTAQTLPHTLRHCDDDPGDHQHAQHHQQRHVTGDDGHGHRGDARHRRAPSGMLAFFHFATGPMPIRNTTKVMMGMKMALKYGAPTEILLD